MVNDGSTDRSAEIAQRYADLDDRFRVVTRRTAASARPATPAPTQAGGEFLAFLDSDDMLLANAYELLVGALDRTGSDFATGNVYRLTQYSAPSSRRSSARRSRRRG